ncbi:HEAT repeat domain-containing protein [Pseudonocardia sp. TMWB2A]|uniref:HEAT repeat domain-containing protein n=1 Tax=Pseudonocardia sp. TMWB2A TaxID=687430 RepID=UPI00307D4F0C
MTPPDITASLSATDPSVRLRAALAAGSAADPALLDALVVRCGEEPDFFVRDMLSWALTRLPAATVLPRLYVELDSPRPRARAQALHTLSKIADPATAARVTPALLRDPDDEVARTAWRTAVVLVPADGRPALAAELGRQLGRGDRAVRLSLSRALTDLGEAADAVLDRAAAAPDPAVATHARATLLLRADPDAGFDDAVEQARRVVALGPGHEVASC